MNKFSATHEIKIGSEVTPVMAVESDEGGLILYTESEWDAGDNADWEYSNTDGLTRLGKPVNNSELVKI